MLFRDSYVGNKRIMESKEVVSISERDVVLAGKDHEGFGCWPGSVSW